MIIAIDGPAGSGKTTVSRLLAKKLGFFYLDTGATYRALTLSVLRKEIALDEYARIVEVAERMNIAFNGGCVFLDGEDVTSQIRMPLIDKAISRIVSNASVREIMVAIQREQSKEKDIVVEGRDITTVVFPEAEYKFYLDADVEERADRRHKELKEKKVDIFLEELKMQIKKRDHADLTREAGPLKKAKDAVFIDTTSLTINQVVDTLAAHIKG